MSLWLDSYCGYNGTASRIFKNDNPTLKKAKTVHILAHLSEDTLLYMASDDRNRFIHEAVRQLNKAADITGVRFTPRLLKALPYIQGGLTGMTFEQIRIAAERVIAMRTGKG